MCNGTYGYISTVSKKASAEVEVLTFSKLPRILADAVVASFGNNTKVDCASLPDFAALYPQSDSRQSSIN